MFENFYDNWNRLLNFSMKPIPPSYRDYVDYVTKKKSHKRRKVRK